ncbi:nucleoside-diphosphate kinase [archaeon CG_4_10_14_0_2_um_filter_Archaea_38_6]|nr:MAG: nucleoside-diphosphate kinase [archaeon CG07_land_8_20_14_0_80_38_8]PIU88239.1 MAG: nucleoside-diphosphate kinase [archaeon CG06_land_8_20_14_3_00_37_11]PJA22977.1 MAG: nucleoside-diphosphate kinase [archaeon CG_4_10_14_0_2_um_filter_Archaea_38_6]
MIEQTLVLIKPDGIYRGLIGNIITRFENAGLKIVGMRMRWIDKDFSKRHYAEHLGKEFYVGLEQYITAGPVMALVLEGVEVIEVVRKMVGSTEPKKALPGTIRGDFAHVSYQQADKEHKGLCNIIHASANQKDAVKEIMLWFDPMDLHTYKRAGEEWTK